MKWCLVFYFAGLIFLALSEALAVCEGPKVAYVQLQGQHPKETQLVDPFLGNDLGLKLSALGYEAENIFDRVESGRYALQNIKILIFASFCTRSHGVDGFLFNERKRLRDFIRRGGCILMFAQGEGRYYEHLLPLGPTLVRSRNEYDRIGHVEKKHPIFARPHGISHRRLNELWEKKDSLNTSLVGESFLEQIPQAVRIVPGTILTL